MKKHWPSSLPTEINRKISNTKNDNRERFNALYKLYKDKKNATARQTEAEREENLKIKLGIIEELKALVQKRRSTGQDIPGIPGLTGTLAEYRNGTSLKGN